MCTLDECAADLASMVLRHSVLGQALYLWLFVSIHENIWLSHPQHSAPPQMT